MNDPLPSESEHTFPLVGLFLTIGVAAIVSGIVATAFSAREFQVEEALLTSSLTGVGLGIAGGIIGGIATYRWAGVLAGGCIGAILGVVCTCLTWLPSNELGKATLSTTLGCGVMLVAAILGRKARRR